MSQYWSELVRQLQPYVPGEQPKIPGLIKLNTNESPFPPSPKVRDALDAADLDHLRLYPDAHTTRLKNSLVRYYGLKPEQIFVGNGSDEVLAFSFMAFFKQEQPLLFPDITYSFYPVYCQLLSVTARMIPLREDFTLALEDYPSANGGIIFPNPNAPTGMALPLSDIEALLERNRDSVVVVDEAYVDFGADSAVALVDRYPNLLVIQTLSKSRALAGLRVGFALGNPELITGLERVKDSFNSYPVDRLAETAAAASMDDREYFNRCRERLIATRDWTTEELEAIGFHVLPSAGNFVFARPPAPAVAEEVAAHLRREKILVRHFPKPRIADYLRITIGSDPEMRQLLDALKQFPVAPGSSKR